MNDNQAMKQYVGTKIINAQPMTRLEYNQLRGWEVPTDENPSEAGYLVEYRDGKPNTEYYQGYISWSPKEQFDAAYVETNGGFNFGLAVQLLRQGEKVARTGWNGKGMFLFYVDGATVEVKRKKGNIIIPGQETAHDYIIYEPHIDMVTAQGTIVPWLASQSDVLALDWVIVE